MSFGTAWVDPARDDLPADDNIPQLASFEWVTIPLVVGCLVPAKTIVHPEFPGRGTSCDIVIVRNVYWYD